MTSWFPGRASERGALKQNEDMGRETHNNYRRAVYFAEAGVEKQSGATGFAYGSESCNQKPTRRNSYGHGRKLDSRTKTEYSSAERIKVKKQQKEMEEDHRAYLEKKEAQRREAAEEKRKDMEQLQEYNPWGRPAAGAPRMSRYGSLNARIQKFSTEPEPPPQSYISTDYNPYGKPGAGAPLKTKSGTLTTQIKGARDIRFQDHLKKEVDYMRYIPDSSDLGKGTPKFVNPLDRVDSEKQRLIEERKQKLIYGKKLEEQRLEAERRHEQEKKEQKDVPIGYIWGRDKVERDESGKLIPRKKVKLFTDQTPLSGITGLAAQMERRGHGALKKSTVTTGTKSPSNNKRDKFDPWGKPGAGAPLRDGNGQIVATGVLGKHTAELEKRSPHEIATIDRNKFDKGGGTDMATWMRTRGVNESTKCDSGQLKRERKLKVTQGYFTDLQAQAECRHKAQQQRKYEDKQLDELHTKTTTQLWNRDLLSADLRTNEKSLREYSDDLKRAMEKKSVQKKQLRENQLALEKKHMYTFNQQWGRPGAGAPRFDSQGHLDAHPKNLGSLETQVYTGRHYRL